MAFNDTKKFSDTLRLKNGSAFNIPGDPEAIRGVCVSPWCGRWVEDMRKDRRCHDPECDKRLWQEALKRKKAVQGKGILVTFPGAIEDMLLTPEEQERRWEGPVAVKINIEYCVKCGKEPKKPHAEYCVSCYGFIRRAQRKDERKQEKMGGREFKPRNRFEHKLANKIKGLDMLK